MRRVLFSAVAVALLASMLPGPATAQGTAPAAAAPAGASMLLTVFFRHDQAKTLDEINEQLRKQGFYKQFPPDGVEVLSWYVVMGIGQVITLRFPPERLREVNRIIEQTAWGPYRTDFYPTYDYKAAAEKQRQEMLGR